MSYLKMALAALQATTGAGEAGAQRCGYTSQAPNNTPTTEAPQEHVLVCYECPWHEHDTVNPSEGWGKCLKRNKGRYGCATACEAALSKPGIHNLKGE